MIFQLVTSLYECGLTSVNITSHLRCDLQVLHSIFACCDVVCLPYSLFIFMWYFFWQSKLVVGPQISVDEDV